jgi:hypothetical protein
MVTVGQHGFSTCYERVVHPGVGTGTSICAWAGK